MTLRAAVITVSDSAYEGRREDRSGPAVRQRLEGAGWTAEQAHLIPDEVQAISQLLSEISNDPSIHAIFTTGGTGVAPRDITPEATRAVIDREIPGIGEWMRMHGRQSVKTAILSRGVAGCRGKTLILNLPGSPKAAVESLEAVLDVLPHVVDLLNGKTEHGK